ncbi:hypothetical protein GJV77_10415 [Myroides pelagicus]|uniref:Uncharacterized protein n=1 Tax=Myroides pelagicus TaxID=270914 RepID=A0A7K1GP24_9FLAO|nr:hypothetical protein [Myroides pelagicus]
MTPSLPIKHCDECNSLYYTHTSAMEGLCPTCAHVLYGYPNCNHLFEGKHCVHCYWDGSMSSYINSILETRKR